MTVPEKLAALRAAMEEKGVDGVYVPSADPHMSEYLPEYYRERSWISLAARSTSPSPRRAAAISL